MVGLSVSTAPVANAASETVTVDNSSAGQVWDEVEKYIIVVGDKRIFDEAAARSAGASEDVIEAGRIYNRIVQEDHATYRGLRIPIWGNWCGPGYGGENGAPVDELDTACMHHDLCYASQGYFSCDCDQQLIDEIDSRWDRMKEKEKVTAVATKGFFTIGKLWCKKYPSVQKEPYRLQIKQNAWVVARYEISWDEEAISGSGTSKLIHKAWSSNGKDRTLRGVDTIDFPKSAKNLRVKIDINTGLAWKPWKTVFQSSVDLVPQRTLELKGTAFRIWVLNKAD